MAGATDRVEESIRIRRIPSSHEDDHLSWQDRRTVRRTGDHTELEHDSFNTADFAGFKKAMKKPGGVEHRRASVCTREFRACLEGELQLVTNDATATVRKLRMQKLSCRRSEDVGRYARASWGKGTHASLPVLWMVEDIVELRSELQGFGLTDYYSLQNVQIPVICTRRSQSTLEHGCSSSA